MKQVSRDGVIITVIKTDGTVYSNTFKRTVKKPIKYYATAQGQHSRTFTSQKEAINEVLKKINTIKK